jgi:putative ABC transport system substrate-binding protein
VNLFRMIDRRGVLRLLGLALTAHAPRAAAADEPRGAKAARIGRLSPLSAESDATNLEAFRRGLRDLGWTEGREFTIESRFADGRRERLPDLAAQLVRAPVDVIVVGSNPGVAAAKAATSTIPIVMVTTGDPVEAGFVASLARPGGNVTGLSALGQALSVKRLELLKEAVPGVSRVGVLVTPRSTYTGDFLRERDSIARALGLHLQIVEVGDPAKFDQAFADMARDRIGALMVFTDPTFVSYRRRLVQLTARHRLPAVFPDLEFVTAGGLMFYGASLADMYARAAGYADKILKGAKPAELPVEQATKLELVVNVKTARALGVAVSPALVARADHLVE